MSEEPKTEVEAIMNLARRWQLLAGTIIVTGVLTAGAVKLITKDVRADVANLRSDLSNRATTDSVRFERTMQVVELAVVALVEAPGSEEQHRAVQRLRDMRRVTLMRSQEVNR